MEWIISNVSWIKDALWILFTLIATIIAFLTYRRARYTLLQPLRSEVVKRQTELMVELLEYISNREQNVYFSIDYMGIIACNTYKLLELCDFVLIDENISKSVEQDIGGFLLLKAEGSPLTFCAPTDPLVNSDTEADIVEKESEYKKQLVSQIHLEQSISNLEVLYLTKTHLQTISQLERYRDNPFMPKQIQGLLNQLLEDITANIKGPLFKELEKFIVRMDAMPSDKENPPQISHQALYNSFLRYGKSHTQMIEGITQSIRQYLYVDAKWS